jgi:ABC-type lipoprotein release transport system permease subunit
MPSLVGVALRNIARTPRRSAMISLAVVGGCASLVFMMGMNAGLSKMTIANSVGLMLGAVQIDSATGERTIPVNRALSVIDAAEGVEGAAPRLQLPVLLGNNSAALIVGIDASREARASKFPRLVTRGSLPALGGALHAAIGSSLASQLGVKIGGAVPVSWLDGMNRVRRSQLVITGIVRTGSDELDQKLVFVPLPTARRWIGASDGDAGAIVVRAADNDDANRLAARIRGRLDPAVYRVRTWGQVSPQLKGMVSYQRGGINIVLAVIYLVVGAGVAAIQLMGILERTREFGVLSSIGFTPGRVIALVAVESLMIGVIAVIAGLLLGAALVTLVAYAGGFDVRIAAGGEGLEGLIGMDPYLRPIITLRAMAFAAGLIGPVLILGGIMPALRAARMTPMDALRR